MTPPLFFEEPVQCFPDLFHGFLPQTGGVSHKPASGHNESGAPSRFQAFVMDRPVRLLAAEFLRGSPYGSPSFPHLLHLDGTAQVAGIAGQYVPCRPCRVVPCRIPVSRRMPVPALYLFPLHPVEALGSEVVFKLRNRRIRRHQRGYTGHKVGRNALQPFYFRFELSGSHFCHKMFVCKKLSLYLRNNSRSSRRLGHLRWAKRRNASLFIEKLFTTFAKNPWRPVGWTVVGFLK